jgi:hypothetical protein
MVFKVQASGAIRTLGRRAGCRRAPGRLGLHGPQHPVALVLRLRKVTAMNLLSHSAPLSPIAICHSVRRNHGTTLSTLSFTSRLSRIQIVSFHEQQASELAHKGAGGIRLDSQIHFRQGLKPDLEASIPGCRHLVCTVKRYLVCARLWASKAVSSLFLSYPVLPTKPPVILLCMW